MSKLVTWLLSALLSLFNNFAPHTQPDLVYTGDPGYAVVNDAVDYSDMYKWYKMSMSSAGGICELKATKHKTEINRKGIGWILANSAYNADAKLEFSDEDIIVAPQRCKIYSQPGTDDKIVVESSDKGMLHFKMVIERPKRWFCCEHIVRTPGSVFRHVNEDHRIQLEVGDTIAVASSDTTIKLYRENVGTGNLEEVTLSKFLLAGAGDPPGNPNLYVNGKGEINKTEALDAKASYSQFTTTSDKTYTGYARWAKNSKGWYYGADSGTPGKDYAANQFVQYKGYYYYFNAQGYMVTGWYDGRYYYPTEDDKTDYAQGAMCYDTIVPDQNGSGYFVRLDKAGNIDTKSAEGQVRVGNTVYVFDSSAGKYKISSIVTGEITDANGGVPGNTGGSSDISKQEEEKITDALYELALSGSPLDSTIEDGWHRHRSRWLYITNHTFRTADYADTYTYGNDSAYAIHVNGHWYFMDTTTNYMVSPGTKVKSSATSDYYYITPDGAMLDNDWFQVSQDKWVYARTGGALYRNGTYAIKGIQYVFNAVGEWSESSVDNETSPDAWDLIGD